MSFREDLNEIIPRLYLGSWEAATDTTILNKFHITHILTIETTPLPRYITCLKHITTKYVEMLDLPSEDLLAHFDDIFTFIEQGISAGAVLVHCYFGVSRSATAVIAYMMKKFKLNYLEAFEKVKRKRTFVYPNEGFTAQLKLYQEMGWQVNKSEKRCKLLRLKMASEKIKECRNVPLNFHDLIQPNPTSNLSDCLKCKHCSNNLARFGTIFPHQDNGRDCSKLYFVEPVAWMNSTEITKGELNCPQCKRRVGAFTWLGWRCFCDFKMSPAFYLNHSEVYQN